MMNPEITALARAVKVSRKVLRRAITAFNRHRSEETQDVVTEASRLLLEAERDLEIARQAAMDRREVAA